MIEALIGPVTGLLDKFIADKDQRERLAFELATMADRHAQEIALAQIKVNEADAKGSWFQSGWRPATGYACVAGLAVNFLVSPLAQGFGVDVPQADLSVMMPLLLGMLGLAGMRTYERKAGVGK